MRFPCQFDLVSSQAEQNSSDIKSTKHEIAKIKRLITKLQADIMAAKEKVTTSKEPPSSHTPHTLIRVHTTASNKQETPATTRLAACF